VWLNITPDHIDRHGDLAGYIAAKRHIFDNQRPTDVAVIGVDDDASKAEAIRLARARKMIGITVRGNTPSGVTVYDGILRDAGTTVDLRGIKTLPGAHNWQNAAAAWSTCRALGLSSAMVEQGLRTYPGLAHRQERVAVVGDIVYINDSKATNADATEKALAAYDTIYWIVGGTAKEEGIAPLAPWFARVVHAFLVGASSEPFAATLEGRVPFTRSGDLRTALEQAHAMAQREHRKGAVVLLSPACASYDQWPNFEARGDAFRTMARALPGAIVETGAAA
jgi:UDP-N-acetylmuramoylalanine--D-glutamate ligase